MYDQSYVDTINNAVENIAEFCRENGFDVIKKYGMYTVKYKDSNKILSWLFPCELFESGRITYKNYEAFKAIDEDSFWYNDDAPFCYIWGYKYLSYAKDLISISNYINHHKKNQINRILYIIEFTNNVDSISFYRSDILDIVCNNDLYADIYFNHLDGLHPYEYFNMYLNKEFVLINCYNHCHLFYTNGLNFIEYMDTLRPSYPDFEDVEIVCEELSNQYKEFPQYNMSKDSFLKMVKNRCDNIKLWQENTFE
ncbi:MAG: hypothetical protein LUG60_00975 [Erysipelotrichaceae bacterium]|nr:hypothetical protein [Erysipelotrichaceae bacterium]